MKHLKTIGLIMYLILLGACTKQATTPEKNSEITKVNLVLDWTPNTNHTGIYVAKEKGYFKSEGIEVNIIQPSDDGAEVMVASNVAQFGISFQDTLAASFTQKLPIKAIASLVAHNTSGLLTRADKAVSRPKQLEGLNYATWDLPIETAMIKHIIEKDGGQFSKLNKVSSTVTDVVSALQTNIDAVWVYQGWDYIATQQAGLQTNYLAFRDIDAVFDYYTPVLITNDTMLSEQKDIVQKLVRALNKGYQYSIEHADEASDILLKAAPELSKDLVKVSQRFLATQYKDKDTPWGYIEPKRWNAFYQWINQQKILEKTLEDNQGFTNEFITH